MANNIKVDVGISKRSDVKVDVDVGKKSVIDIGIESDKNRIPTFGFDGQVLTKISNYYRWKDSPIRVNTFEELPTNPSEHCLYLITDIAKLVYWDNNSWVIISSSANLLYDDEEEMMYLG